MAKKLYMTTEDYLVIAISPALIMALVGSLVYFLIEVFYAGDYAARLNYAFGLFVFAAVLIARISIEEGQGICGLVRSAARWCDVPGSVEVCGTSESVFSAHQSAADGCRLVVCGSADLGLDGYR